MDLIALNNWSFVFEHNSPLDKALGRTCRAEHFAFHTPRELLEFLSSDKHDNLSRFQSAINDRLTKDPNAKAWKAARTRRSDLRHFLRYRRTKYCDIYHAAAGAVVVGTADQQQIAMVQGLEDEVNASKVRLPIGQTVFHGRADRDLTGLGLYTSFISASLHPIVARYHALKRAAAKKNRPVVYILTARVEMPTIWGQAGKTLEWELLLPPRLFVEQRSATTSGEFDIVEADIVGRGGYT